MSELGNKAAEVASAESKRPDTDEVTDNRSPRIDEYLKLVDLAPKSPTVTGNEWCGAFVYWCYNEAAKALNQRNPLPLPHTRGGRALRDWANAHKSWIVYTIDNKAQEEPTLEPGDVFVVASLSHIGMVFKPIPNGDSAAHRAFTSIEGNQMDSAHPNWGNKGILVKRVEVGRCAVIIRPPAAPPAAE